MNKTKVISAMLVCGTLLAGCATITRGDTEAVKFQSKPVGAMVSTSLGQSCTTPCQIEVKRKVPFNAKFTLNGKSLTVAVKTAVSNTGAATTVGNVIAGGVIGIGVDAVTGASLDHYPNPVIVDFTTNPPSLVQVAK